MLMKSGMAFEPSFDLRMLMGRVVVYDQMHILLRWDLLINQVEKFDPLLISMVLHARSNDHCTNKKSGCSSLDRVIQFRDEKNDVPSPVNTRAPLTAPPFRHAADRVTKSGRKTQRAQGSGLFRKSSCATLRPIFVRASSSAPPRAGLLMAETRFSKDAFSLHFYGVLLTI
jgi:hypothetical protein